MATELTDIEGVGATTAKKLQGAGIKTVDDLARTSPEDTEVPGISTDRLEQMISEAQQSAALIQSADEVEKEYNSKRTVRTGIEGLDDLVGGWKEDAVVAIYGESGTGKTQLAFKSIVEAAEQTGRDVVYIETEKDRFSPERLRALANDPSVISQIYRVKAHDLDRQFNAYGKVSQHFDDVALIVIDSFTAQFRLSGDFSGRENLPSRNEMMGEHLKAVNRMAEKVGAPVIMTAQVYGTVDAFSKKNVIPYGGHLMAHTVTYFIHTRRASGELRSINIENHPSIGEEKITVSITDDDIITVNVA